MKMCPIPSSAADRWTSFTTLERQANARNERNQQDLPDGPDRDTAALRASLKVGDTASSSRVTGPRAPAETAFMNVAALSRPSTPAPTSWTWDVSRLSDEARLRAANEKIGFIFQLQPDPGPRHLRQRRRAAALPRPRQKRTASSVSERARGRRPVLAHAPHAPTQLSAAAAARRDHARSPATRASCSADEPTGNVDSLMARQVMDCSSRSTRWAPRSSW